VFQDFIADEEVKANLIKVMQFRPNFFHTSIFKDTPENYLQEIILNSKQKSYQTGEVIIQEGDIGDELFLILKGSCEVSKVIDDCKVVVKILDKDDIFGEMAVFSNSKVRKATVRALEPSEVAIISKDYLSEIAESIPSIFYNLTIVMDERRKQDINRG